MQCSSHVDVMAQLPVCRTCLRHAGDVCLTQRSVVGLSWLFNVTDDPANLFDEMVSMCSYCIVRLKQCLQFIDTARKNNSKLLAFLSDKSCHIKDTCTELFSMNRHESHSLSKQSTGQIDLPSNVTLTSDVASHFVIEYPKPKFEGAAVSVLDAEQVKIELLPFNDGCKVEYDFDSQNLCEDTVTETHVASVRKKKLNCVSKNKIMPKSIDDRKEGDLIQPGKYNLGTGSVKKHKKESNKKHNVQFKENSRISRKDLEMKMASMKFAIVYLNIEEQHQEIENNKKSEKYMKSPHKCEFCGAGFILRDSYENHMFKHSESRGAHECDICKLRFARPTLLQCHVRDHTRHFRCTACGATARSYTDCDRHYARCAGYNGPVRCDHCGNYMKDTYSLHKHILHIHRNSKKFTCDYCKKDFKQKISLQNHIRRHTGERPYACARCAQTFSSHYCLKQHALVHAPRAAHYCVECDTRYRSLSSLRQHLARSPRHHNTRPEFKHACVQCDKRYYSRGELRSHVTTAHTAPEERLQLQCTLCPKAYLHAHVLRRHVRAVHQGVQRSRNHACQQCGKAFTERFRLVNHARTHTGERPFTCPLCPATFAHKSAASAHAKAKHPAPA